MNIKPSDKEKFKNQGVKYLKEIIEEEHSACLNRLKKATDISILRYTQGQVSTLESIQELMAEV